MPTLTTRWLCLLLLLFLSHGAGGQLSIGNIDSFLPEHLDAADAATVTGKVPEVTSLADASDTNAAAAGADSTSPGPSQADDFLMFSATDLPPEEMTLPDFDDYATDEMTMTTESYSPLENDISQTDHDDPATGDLGAEESTTAVPQLTRRIVFAGPDATRTISSDHSARPSSAIRSLDDPNGDSWLPNWPTELLINNEEPTRRPTIRFPTESPTAYTPRPSYTVSKVPVTQYYFDLATVTPTAIPGPLFDREDISVPVSASPSEYPSSTGLNRPVDLSSSVSELQSSVLVDAAGSVSFTPTLTQPVSSAVTAPGHQSISPTAVMQALSPTSASLIGAAEGEVVSNTILEEKNQNDTTIKEDSQPPRFGPSVSDPEGDLNSANTTAHDDGGLVLPTPSSEIFQVTTEQPTTQSPTRASPSVESGPITTTSPVTPGSVKSSSVRPSQTSRIPLWQRLSQSSPSRSVNTLPPSTPLIPSVATTPATDPVTASASTPFSEESITIDPLASDESPSPALTTAPPISESTEQSLVLDDPNPSAPPNIDNSAEIQIEPDNVTVSITDPPIPAPDPAGPSSTEPPFVEGPQLIPDGEPPVNNTIQGSDLNGNLSISIDQNTYVDDESTVDIIDNALDDTHLHIFSDDNISVNQTEHGNKISDDPVMVSAANDSMLAPMPVENAPVPNSTEVVDTSPSTESATWTPIIEVTETTSESVSVPTSLSSVVTTTTPVSQEIPELLGGFTPITSSTLSARVPHSEIVPKTSHSHSSTSIAASVDSTTTATASAQDPSTLSAHSPTLSASLVPTTVQKTDSVSDGGNLSVTESIYSDVNTNTKVLLSSSLLPTTLHTSEREETSVAPQTPIFTEPLQTFSSSDLVASEVESTMVDDLPEPTTTVTERPPSSPTVATTKILPSPSDTSVHASHMTHTDLSSVPPLHSISQSSDSSVIHEMSASSSVLPDTPKSLASVFYQTITEPTASPTLPDIPVSSPVPVFPDVPVSSVVPIPHDIPTSSVVPTPPDILVSSPVPVFPDVPVSSALPDIPVSSVLPVFPDKPISSASVAVLPTLSARPTADSSTLVVPTATTTGEPILLPQPDQGEEEGTREEPPPEKVPEPEEMRPSDSSPPPPAVAPPTTTTTTSTSTLPPSTTTSTTTTTTTTTQSTSTTFSTSPVPTIPHNDTTTESSKMDVMPTLTTTMVLENGTAVEVELPYIRALVDYSTQEFCRHKHNFRSMFAQWITQHLDSSIRKVLPSDIQFFSMAECPHPEDLLHMLSDDLSTKHEAIEKPKTILQEEETHTHVYFYVTSAGEADPGLTEKFPLFPTDLEISEDLTYLKPRVMELELVRPEGYADETQQQEQAAVGTSVIVVIVLCSIVGVTIIVLLLFFMVVKRRGATNNYYGRRCTPVSMDAYSMDSVSVYHSFRRKSKRRASGRSIKSYLNQAFDDPNGPSRPLNFAKLTHFISDIDGVHEEFGTIPVNMPKYDELPAGVEDKNRYANVIPVPETRVLLKVTKDGRNCEYINANFVRGARNESKYYIATQAPLDDTVADFWRMIWEQETRVVVMLTDFVEKGIDKCADYLPPSETLDCHRLYGDFQVTLKSRDMREKFVVSNVQLKNLENNLVREVAHMWFTGWPASGVPNEETAFISYILEVRRTRKKLRAKGPIVVHCSPGTGRTGTFLACDMVMKQFEEHRNIDVPRTVYTIRRDRAGAVQTKEQYAFIYRVINLYASKLTSGNLESL